ncbi:low-specificity L-threonine aldolase [Ktedonosporobacter rubrisoli]|uniref:Low-specificity L-threonine aldolase n=1 Tax=Ktedonosporobacter rubrisoli TaxID=2509675 RepID=A0A4P6JRG6_KTERU|nr:low-specificity L-threonine aldolase [Ktedonosporobacter rubrisoli]QBD77893.1 low-specificity L-threonine aldolase [Ktedonosporobacter rubrisoli]
MSIDLRSDTVTLPSPAMREAMYQAELGDDVYGEDPTINRLQELAAERTGKEAALFVPSGTMGNAIATLVHAQRGRTVIAGDASHIYNYEAGGPSTLGGSPLRPVPNLSDGMLDLDKLRAELTDESDTHIAPAALVCIENTHNRCGGAVLNQSQIETIANLAHAQGVAVHIDGARIFNAAIALGVPVHELARPVDSLMFCLSKGLSAPVGSMLVGNKEFIRQATRVRKLLGGGMRQAGVLAAAGIIALEQMVERLAEDHKHCKQLAQGLADFPQIEVDPERVATNILIFQLRDSQQQPLTPAKTARFLQLAGKHGVLMGSMGEKAIRAVTHYGIEAEHITSAITGIRRALIDTDIE